MLLLSSRPPLAASAAKPSPSTTTTRPRPLAPARAAGNGTSNGNGSNGKSGNSGGNSAASAHLDAPVALKSGAPLSGPDLSVTVNGLRLPNPFVIGSGPPGTNYQVMKRAFDDGWGAVICKTLSLDSKKVVNVTPRYAKLRDSAGAVFGWENMELISDRPFETMLDEIKRLKTEYPDRVLIASVMEECNRGAWEEVLGRCAEAGADAFEINFSCPHGMPERRMGMAMGQDPELLAEVSGWIRGATTLPVWGKMTPNITDITAPARACLDAGLEGVSAINTVACVMGVDLDTLRPIPTVEGRSTPGGYSGRAVKPMALAKVAALAGMIAKEEKYKGRSLSGIGGVETGADAAEFLLLGSDTVQVCTGVMLHGYPLVGRLCGGLQKFMEAKGFASIGEFRGAALPYVTTHSDLVQRQRGGVAAAKKEKEAAAAAAASASVAAVAVKAPVAAGAGKMVGLASDAEWTGDNFVADADSMVANK